MSFPRKRESLWMQTVIPAQAGIAVDPNCHSRASGNRRGTESDPSLRWDDDQSESDPSLRWDDDYPERAKYVLVGATAMQLWGAMLFHVDGCDSLRNDADAAPVSFIIDVGRPHTTHNFAVHHAITS
jgi:hypothetical protein